LILNWPNVAANVAASADSFIGLVHTNKHSGAEISSLLIEKGRSADLTVLALDSSPPLQCQVPHRHSRFHPLEGGVTP
jgi:hypothetical protein